MKEVLVRSLTGLLFIGVLVGSIVWNQYSVAILFLFVAMVGLFEFYRLMNKAGFRPNKVVGFIAGGIIYCLIALQSMGELGVTIRTLSVIFPILVTIVVVELFRKSEWPVSNIAFTVLSIIYIVMPLASLNYLAYFQPFNSEVQPLDANGILNTSSRHYEYALLLGFFIIMWCNDTGAYCFGRLFGRTKLFERISPNKTWEGFIGGAATAVGGALLFAHITGTDKFHWTIISLIIVVFGTLGDLTESQIKRSVGVKDAGNFLPGHGGILDRFDGVLYAAPFVLTYFLLIRAETINLAGTLTP